MHRGNHGILRSVHRNPQRCRDAHSLDFRAWSMRTLFSCLKCFRPVVQILYLHNSLRSLSLHFYVTNCSKRIGRRLCSACADQENRNVVSSPQANSGPQCDNDPCCLQGKHGFFQPEKKNQGNSRLIRHVQVVSIGNLGMPAVISDFSTTG